MGQVSAEECVGRPISPRGRGTACGIRSAASIVRAARRAGSGSRTRSRAHRRPRQRTARPEASAAHGRPEPYRRKRTDRSFAQSTSLKQTLTPTCADRSRLARQEKRRTAWTETYQSHPLKSPRKPCDKRVRDGGSMTTEEEAARGADKGATARKRDRRRTLQVGLAGLFTLAVILVRLRRPFAAAAAAERARLRSLPEHQAACRSRRADRRRRHRRGLDPRARAMAVAALRDRADRRPAARARRRRDRLRRGLLRPRPHVALALRQRR